MKTKIIDGSICQLRDVVYSDFGATTEEEKAIQNLKASEEFKTKEAREAYFSNLTYSWDRSDNPYEYTSDLEDSALEKIFSDNLENELSEEGLLDTEYTSAGMLASRLLTLKRPLHIQLKDLYREHSRFYRSKKNLKPQEADLLIEDFRYEMHRIIAKAKDQVVNDGGNMDTILKVTSIASKGGPELQSTLRKLTILFKQVEQAVTKFGYIPRPHQTRMNDALSVLVSHFILDVYGTELERRKTESSDFNSGK